MLNIILILLCVHYISVLYFKPTSTLYCGLFGFTGDDKPDFKALVLLGLLNTSRGTDSAGIYYNQKIYKDTDVFTNELALTDFNRHKTIKHNVFIGHTRSRSVGRVSLSNVHPFLYYNEPHPTKEGNSIITYNHNKYYNEIFAHNGTLKLWEKWAVQNGLDTADLDIDSKVLGQLVCEDMEKAVTEYIGGAAFLHTSLHGNKSLFAWKGAAGSIEERPLHYVKIGKGYYISSLREHLEIAFPNQKYNIKEVGKNELIEFKGSKIVSSKFIHRSFEKSRIKYDNDLLASRNVQNNTSVYNTNKNNISILRSILYSQSKKNGDVVLDENLQYCTATDSVKVFLDGPVIITNTYKIITEEESKDLESDKFKTYYFIKGYLFFTEEKYKQGLLNKHSEYQVKYYSNRIYTSAGNNALVCKKGVYVNEVIFPPLTSLQLEIEHGVIIEAVNYDNVTESVPLIIKNLTVDINQTVEEYKDDEEIYEINTTIISRENLPDLSELEDAIKDGVENEDLTLNSVSEKVYVEELTNDFNSEIAGLLDWVDALEVNYKDLPKNTHITNIFNALDNLSTVINN